MEKFTKVETYRVEKHCPKCATGFMVCNGRGITQIDSYWEHVCNNKDCRHAESYTNITYPTTFTIGEGEPLPDSMPIKSRWGND